MNNKNLWRLSTHIIRCFSQWRRAVRTLVVFGFLLNVNSHALTLYWGGTSAQSWTATSGTRWGTVEPTYNTTWTSGSDAVFNVANSTITGASTAFASLTVNENVTVTATGTLTTGGTVAPITVASGKTFNFGSQDFSTASGTGLRKEGSGTLTGNLAAYPGGFILNAGVVSISGVNTLGTGPLTINGGTIQGNSGAARDLSGKPSGITVGGNFIFGGTAQLTFNQTIALGGAVRTITVDDTAAGGVILSGVISGTAGNGLTKQGAGLLTLAGVNTYSGKTVINAGTIQTAGETAFGANPASFVSDQITLNGGTIGTTSGNSITFSSNRGLTLGASGGTFSPTASGDTITLQNVVAGTASGTLTVAGSGTVSMTGTHTYNGNTIVSTGTFKIGTGGSIANTPTVFIAASAILDVSTAGFAFTGSGTVQTLAGSSSSGTATINAPSKTLTLNSGALLAFQAAGGGSTTVGKISVSGTSANLALNNNVVTINVTGSALGAGTYRLIDCTGTLTGSANATPTISGIALTPGTTASITTTTGTGGHVDLVVSLGTPPTLTAAVGATVDNPFDVTFTDNPTWRAAITSITVAGTTLTSGTNISAGVITFTPSASVPAALLQTNGTRTIAVKATGYSDATVSQAIGFGVVTKIAVVTQPTAPASNGGTLATQPAVAYEDQYGNTNTTASGNITAAVGAGTWTLGGTVSVAPSSGVVTFSGLTATSLGPVTGATLTFSTNGIVGATSSTFSIPAPPPPTLTAAVGATVDNPFDVTFTDNPTWRAAITSITVAGTTLTSGTNISAGVITFTPSASVPAALLQTNGTRTIAVKATGYSDATVSQAIGFGAVAKIAVVRQPTSPSINGGPLAIQPAVAYEDQYGNTNTTASGNISAAVGSGTWTLGGTASVAPSSGVATFSGLTATSLAQVTGATITFATNGIIGATSSSFTIPSPPSATYYSDGVNNDPTSLASWWSNNNGTGNHPGNFSNGDSFTIQNGHSMTNTSAWAITGGTTNKIQIQNGGTLQANALVSVPNFQVDNGGKYIHNVVSGTANGAASDIPGTTSRSLGASSTVEIQSWANGGTAPVALPAPVSWGNLTINVTSLGGSWAQAGSLTSVAGTLTIKATGGLQNAFNLATSQGYILTVRGDLLVQGGKLELVSAGGTATNNIAGNLTITGGKLDIASGTTSGWKSYLNVTNNFTITGGTNDFSYSLNNNNFSQAISVYGNVSVTGSGAIDSAGGWVTSIYFSKAGTQTYTGGGYVKYVYWYVNNGATVDFGTGSLSETFLPSGTTFTLFDGGGIITANTAGINGCFTGGATASLSFAGNYTFNGNSAQVTGTLLPALVYNLTNNNPAGLTLTASTIVSNTLAFTAGILDTAANGVGLTVRTNIFGTSSTAYVNGPLSRLYTALGSKVFPTGRNGNYRPLSFNYAAAPSAASIVTVEQIDPGVTNGVFGFGGTFSGATLFSNRYWNVTQSGATTPTFTMQLDGTGFSPAGTGTIFHYANGVTTKLVTSLVSPGSYTNTVPWNTFGSFALADVPPLINTSGSLAALSTTYGTASATTVFALSGSDISGGITVTAPTGFEISRTNNSAFSGSVTVPGTGTIVATNIFVRLAATATVSASPYSGNIVCSSAGAASVNVPTVSSTVSPKALTITGLTGVNKTYDGTTTATTSGTATPNGVVAGDTVNLGGTPVKNFADANVGTSKPITITGYTISGASSGNYTLTQPTGVTASITAQPLTITGLTGVNKTYDATTTASVTGTATLNGVLAADTANVTLGGTPTFSFSTATVGNGKTVTTVGYTISGTASGNYSLTQPTLSANITKATPIITASPTASGINSAQTLAASVLTGGSATGAGGASLPGSFAFTSPATTPSVGTSSQNVTFTPTDTVNYNTVATTASVTVTAAGYAGTGEFNKISATADVTDGFYVVAYSTSQAMNNDNTSSILGNTAISPTANKITNPNTTIVWKITANSGAKTIYNEAAAKYVSYTGSANSVFLVDTATSSERWNINWVSPVFTIQNASSTTRYLQYNTSSPRFACYTGSQQDITLYKLTPVIAGAATTTAFTTTYGTASPAQTFSVSGSGLTANLVATAPTGFEVSSDGAIYGTTASFTPTSGVATGSLRIRLAATAPVGSYNSQNITLTSAGATTVNITTASSGNNVSAKGLTITGLTGSDKVYDGLTTASFTGTAAYSGLVNGETPSVTGTPSASFATAAVGNGKTIAVSGYTPPSANYSLTQPSLTGNVTPATLTYTANSASMTYGGTVPSLSGSVTGFVNGEDQAGATTGTLAFTTTATASSAPGSYAITGSGLSAANYSFVQAAGNATALTIGKATPTFALVSSSNPTGFKDSLSFTANNFAAGLTGTVQFKTNDVNLGAPVTISGQSAASVTANGLPRGDNAVAAVYSGDENYLTATVNLTQSVTNHPPTPGPHNLGAVINTPLNVSASALAALTYDADGDPLTITAVSGSSTNGGTVLLSEDFATITYTPVGNYVGADQFTYTVSDGFAGGSTTSTARVNVRLANATSVINYVSPPVDNTVNLRGYGIPGRQYDIQVSGDMANWSVLATVTAAANGIILYTDTQAETSPRYYRFAVH